MLHVQCSGTSRKIGFHHGQQAIEQVHGSIKFYEGLFRETTGMSWLEVCGQATRFLDYLQLYEPGYVEEMHGLAEGASAPFESVLALNVRTEIAYGMFKDDGCTALSWSSDDRAILAQNWDWRPAQKANLIRLTITRPSHTLSMVTEAGILGKIGLNSAGYGVCLNALRVAGVDFAKLPVHLALRKVLDFDQPGQLNKLVSSLQARGIATSAHILIANSENAVGLEATHKDVKVLHERASNTSKILTHTNHLILSHEDIEERLDLPDSQPRLKRINELINAQTKPPNPSSVLEMLKDEEGYPASICRESANQSTSATCFSIIMDLEAKMAACKLGRPNAGGEEFEINFVD